MFHNVTIWYRLRYVAYILLIVMCMPLLSLLPPVVDKSTHSGESKSQQAGLATAKTKSRFTYDSPNAVTAGLAEATFELKRHTEAFADNAGSTMYKASLSAYNGLRQVGKFTASAGKSAALSTGVFLTQAAHVAIDSVIFVVRGVGSVLGLFTKMPVVSAYVRPADEMSTPKIDKSAAVAVAGADQDKPANHQHDHEKYHQPNAESDLIWPISGEVTTLYGVPHWPFQDTHTGIDISSGRPSGVTPIRPFKAGRVIEVVHTPYGLGNHVVVDHGGGLTSVYAHLASISVEKDDKVSIKSVLGYEGSTGVSTGTHLHFEIRQDGQPVNPKQHIDD